MMKRPSRSNLDTMQSTVSLPSMITVAAMAAAMVGGLSIATDAALAQQRGGDRWANAGTAVGEALPALEVIDLNGKTVSLSDRWSKRPVLLVTASLTCPVARKSCPSLKATRDALHDTADVVILYTIEAHPTGSASPYRPNDAPWVTRENQDSGILREQPATLEARLALARDFQSRTSPGVPILVDQIDNRAWTALGGGPNMAVLVDTKGIVQLKQGWLDSDSVIEAVQKEVTKPPTTPSPSESPKESPVPADSRANRRLSASGHDITPLPKDQVETLAKKLSPEAYRVTQKSATEAPGSCGVFLDNKMDGVYTCIVCGLPLFASDSKFHSGTGWPSFFAPADPDHVTNIRDSAHGMERVEIVCTRCNSHLGHVFEDGPRDKTGLRYCLNGVALEFHEKGTPLPKESQPAMTSDKTPDKTSDKSSDKTTNPAAAAAPSSATAYFAGGCFWGVEHIFAKCPGVLDAVSGYMNGSTDAPTYEEVCSHKSGHAEAVKVVYDPSRVSYRQLLQGFFLMHDPTQLDRQGPDVGDQYRSAVFSTDEKQLAEAKAFVAELAGTSRYKGKRIVTVIEPAKTFHKAEDYHQDYVERTGRACHVSDPWPTVFGAAVR